MARDLQRRHGSVGPNDYTVHGKLYAAVEHGGPVDGNTEQLTHLQGSVGGEPQTGAADVASSTGPSSKRVVQQRVMKFEVQRKACVAATFPDESLRPPCLPFDLTHHDAKYWGTPSFGTVRIVMVNVLATKYSPNGWAAPTWTDGSAARRFKTRRYVLLRQPSGGLSQDSEA